MKKTKSQKDLEKHKKALALKWIEAHVDGKLNKDGFNAVIRIFTDAFDQGYAFGFLAKLEKEDN